MPTKQAETLRRFDEEYRMACSSVLRELQRRVLGSPMGGNSYTTATQVEQLAELLDLRPGRRLLEVGAGIGWPGLLLAELTGCDVVLTDVPLEGLRVAASFAEAGGSERSSIAAANGEALPFRPGSFDAVSHSDVLC
jgi:ubiquinone/menaquinone biosynthesis C-methylase UbiE